MHSHNSLQQVSTVELTFLLGFTIVQGSFAPVVVTFSTAFLRTLQQCVLWSILKANVLNLPTSFVYCAVAAAAAVVRF